MIFYRLNPYLDRFRHYYDQYMNVIKTRKTKYGSFEPTRQYYTDTIDMAAFQAMLTTSSTLEAMAQQLNVPLEELWYIFAEFGDSLP